MSENEVHKGKISQVDTKGGNIEDYLKAIFVINGKEKDGCYETYTEDAYSVDHIVVDDVLYKVEDTELDAYGFTDLSKDVDGNINYIAMYYNGGAYITEVLEEIIKEEK